MDSEGGEGESEEDAAAEDVPLVEVVDVPAGGRLPVVAGKHRGEACRRACAWCYTTCFTNNANKP